MKSSNREAEGFYSVSLIFKPYDPILAFYIEDMGRQIEANDAKALYRANRILEHYLDLKYGRNTETS